MTLHEAIRSLLVDYELALMAEMIRDECKGDPTHPGLSATHPRVVTFQQILQVLRAELAKEAACR